ncbi:hypothetical protein [Cytobacillus horneckiae]|uniref:hypothetical protein n=1 Tax=Cytobacillus horneckiae TaxID=549687 RepID=UPI003D2128B8
MKNTVPISLSTHELAFCLALCGYESMGSQIFNSMQLSVENEADRFIQETEISLRRKGFWDEDRSTMLVSGLEDLLHLLVHSKKKIRSIKSNQVLFIHMLDQKNVLFQEILGQSHFFSIQAIEEGLTNLLEKHLGLDKESTKPENGFQTLLFSEQMYDELHQLDPSVLEKMVNDPALDVELRQFFADFKENNQEFDNMSFMEMDYIKDYIEIKQVNFLLPSKHFIWNLNYEKIEQEEVYIIPENINEYCKGLNEAIMHYFFQGTAPAIK